MKITAAQRATIDGLLTRLPGAGLSGNRVTHAVGTFEVHPNGCADVAVWGNSPDFIFTLAEAMARASDAVPETTKA